MAVLLLEGGVFIMLALPKTTLKRESAFLHATRQMSWSSSSTGLSD